MDDLYLVFQEKLYISGFLQRREYVGKDGKRRKGDDRAWIRCYIELRGPILKCWRGTSCDADPLAISRLKDEATVNKEMTFADIDTRMVEVKEVKDFAIDRETHNAIAVCNAEGINVIHLMASNSTLAKQWYMALLRGANESYLVDQRYTMEVLNGGEASSFGDFLLPDPPVLEIKWPGSMEWLPCHLSIEAKKPSGFLSSTPRVKCVYIYSIEGRGSKKKMARLGSLSAVHVFGKFGEQDDRWYFTIEGMGKSKSDRLGQLTIVDKVWFRCRSRPLQIKWVSILRNRFEISNKTSIFSPPLPDEADIPIARHWAKQSQGSSASSRNSMNSNHSKSTESSSNAGIPLNQSGYEGHRNVFLDSPFNRPLTTRSNSLSSSENRSEIRSLKSFKAETVDVQSRMKFDPVSLQPQGPSARGPPSAYHRGLRPLKGDHFMPTPSLASNPMMMPYYMAMPGSSSISLNPTPPMLQPPPPWFQPYHHYHHCHSDINGAGYYPPYIPTDRSDISSLRRSKSQHSFGDDRRRNRNPAYELPTLAKSVFSKGHPSKRSESRLSRLFLSDAEESLLYISDTSSCKNKAKSSLQSFLTTSIRTKPYGVIECGAFYRLFDEYCKGLDLPSSNPSEVAEWMQEMGYTLKISTLADVPRTETCWHHIAFKLL